MRNRRDPVPRQIMSLTVVVALLLLAIGVLRLGLADVQQNEIAQALEEGAENTTSLDDLLGTATATDAGVEVGGGGEGDDVVTPVATQPAPVDSTPTSEATTTTSTTTTTTTTTTTLPAEPVDYLAIGDSVMLGAAGVLSDRGYFVNAQVSRQMIDVVPQMEQLGEAGLLGDPIIIHLGTNGPITRETLDALLAPLSSVPNVIMLNVRANRSWTAANNQILAERDTPGDNINLVDWNSLSNNCPGDCFAADGIHLNAAGSEYYANLIGDWTGR